LVTIGTGGQVTLRQTRLAGGARRCARPRNPGAGRRTRTAPRQPDFTTPAGATEIRLYHPGLASDQDLRAAAAAVDRFLSARLG
jgi:hypothetical protein